jgi:hypothetical protein
LLVFLAMPGFAQIKGSFNYLDFANKPYYFGITLGYNTSRFKVAHSRNFILNDSLLTAEASPGPGFNLGMIANLKVGEYFDFRVLPTLSFAERTLNYQRVRQNSLVNGTAERKVESVFVELPFHVRYKSEIYNDLRVFVVAGVKYSYDVASDSRSRQAADLVKISPTDFSIEYGAGVQIYFPYFIFSPEIKMSHGVGNILIYDGRLQQSSVIEKIQSRVLTISLNFEG